MRADVSVEVEKFAGDGFVTRSRKKPPSVSLSAALQNRGLFSSAAKTCVYKYLIRRVFLVTLHEEIAAPCAVGCLVSGRAREMCRSLMK